MEKNRQRIYLHVFLFEEEMKMTSELKLRPIVEKDIPILYEMLKEMLSIQYSSVNEKPLPSFEDSKKFVMKYLQDNENHDIDNWYMLEDENGTILGSTKISKSNYISYQILEKFQNKGLGTKAVQLLMEKHPKKRYFATINKENDPSIKLISKLGFHPKATVYEKIIE